MRTRAVVAPIVVEQVDRRTRNSKKSVSWDTVEIREYPMVLCSNPSTHSGPAVELGWEYSLASAADMIAMNEDVTDAIIRSPCEITQGRTTVDHYETIRPSERRRRRPVDMYMASKTRQALVEEDSTAEEIKEAMLEQIELARERMISKRYITNWAKNKPRRVLKLKHAVKNLQKKQVPKNIYPRRWLPLQVAKYHRYN